MSSWKPAGLHDLTYLSVGNTIWELGREGSETKKGGVQCVSYLLAAFPHQVDLLPALKESHKMVLILIEMGGSMESSVQGLP